MKRFTTEVFIKKAQQIHGINTYDYSKADYTKTNFKVTIICPEHKEFTQIAHYHLQGKGCHKCGIKKRMRNKKLNKINKVVSFIPFTLQQFIDRAIEVHGNKYDYSKTNYVNSRTLIKIICPEHKEFTQLPSHHLQGRGCQKCGRIKLWITRKNTKK